MRYYFSIMLVLLFSISLSAQNYYNQAEVLSSGGGKSTAYTYSNFCILGESVVHEHYSAGNYTTKIGFIFSADFKPDIPENLIITITDTDVEFSWDISPGASSYTVYSSSDPYTEHETWTVEEDGITVTHWSEPIPNENKFYFVKAID